MPSRTLIAAAIGIPLLIGGTVLVVKASSSSDSEAPAAAAATAVEKPAKAPPRPPSAKPPAPKLPPLDPELKPAPVPPPAPTAPPTGDTETSKATDPKPSGTERDQRREIYRQHGRTVADFARTNPHVQDSATQAEVAAKLDIIRKRTLMDKFACNAPESKERMELLSPEERAKWELRCGRTNGTAPAGKR